MSESIQPNQPQAAATKSAASGAEIPLDVIQQIGSMARMLHDTLHQLGVLPALQEAADGIPDARSRLSYVASKTADSANRALSAVDSAKDDLAACKRVTHSLRDLNRKAAQPAEATPLIEELLARHEAIDTQLTEILLAQDFHDLTGQVISKVVRLANDLEDGLLKLLVQVVGVNQRERTEGSTEFQGPSASLGSRPDVLKNQSEVDDLLSSLGF